LKSTRQFIVDKTGENEGSETPNAIKCRKQREKKKAKLAEVELEAARLRGEVSTPGSTPRSTPVSKNRDTAGSTPPDTETETDQTQKKEGTREVAIFSLGLPNDWFGQFWRKYPQKIDPKGSSGVNARTPECPLIGC
jgi:hypothetical protein